MSANKKSLLYSGKAKSLYETDEYGLLWSEFRDDTSAFDGLKTEKFRNKGKVNNYISAHIMQALESKGVPTHFKGLVTDTACLVKRLTMIPVECVIRNVAAGSLCRRLGVQNGLKLDPPIFELFFKDDELHDPLINEDHAIGFGWATQEQLKQMRVLTYKVNEVMQDLFSDAGLMLVDAKFEFGVCDGQMYLGDEISPDSCRIWDKLTHKPLDKDVFRKDIGNLVEVYFQVADRLGVELSLEKV